MKELCMVGFLYRSVLIRRFLCNIRGRLITDDDLLHHENADT